MSEEQQTTTGIDQAPDASAATENTDQAAADRMIPKRRFDEVNAKARQLEAKLAEYERQQMTETERLRAEAAEAKRLAEEAQQRLRQAAADAAIARAAAREGVDPELLSRLVDVEFDDDGAPVNVDQSVRRILDRYPHLKPQPAVQLATTNPQRRSKLSLEDIKRMSEREINERWQEVQDALASN